MAAAFSPMGNSETTQPVEDGLRFVARQPILDARGIVQAYALLFRGGADIALRGASERAAEKAAGTVLDHAVLLGFDRLTRGLPAFVTCSGEALSSGTVHLLPPSLTVLEIAETASPCRN